MGCQNNKPYHLNSLLSKVIFSQDVDNKLEAPLCANIVHRLLWINLETTNMPRSSRSTCSIEMQESGIWENANRSLTLEPWPTAFEQLYPSYSSRITQRDPSKCIESTRFQLFKSWKIRLDLSRQKRRRLSYRGRISEFSTPGVCKSTRSARELHWKLQIIEVLPRGTTIALILVSFGARKWKNWSWQQCQHGAEVQISRQMANFFLLLISQF